MRRAIIPGFMATVTTLHDDFRLGGAGSFLHSHFCGCSIAHVDNVPNDLLGTHETGDTDNTRKPHIFAAERVSRGVL